MGKNSFYTTFRGEEVEVIIDSVFWELGGWCIEWYIGGEPYSSDPSFEPTDEENAAIEAAAVEWANDFYSSWDEEGI